MSRLYGRSFDAYNISKYLNEIELQKYSANNKKIGLDELIDSTSVLDLYLPEQALDYLMNYPIHIVRSTIIPRNLSTLPNEKEKNATIYFKGFNFKEEYKRELIFFLGVVLSVINPDKLPNEFELNCEYGDLFPLLLEYLYLKKIDRQDDFSLKHLNEVKWNGKKYIKSYDAYQKYLLTDKYREFFYMSDDEDNKVNKYNKNLEKQFLSATLNTLVPLSSMDGVLELIDKLKDDDEIKNLVKLLFENKNNNRGEILSEYGIESFGLKRLKKEINTFEVKR